MAGKKTDEVAKDFFGDDASWFDEDDGSPAPPAPPAPPAGGDPSAAPPAPPAPVPTAPLPDALQDAGMTADAAAPDAPVALDSGSAPTMMFSLDQLPEFPLPLQERLDAGQEQADAEGQANDARGVAATSMAPTEEILREPSSDLAGGDLASGTDSLHDAPGAQDDTIQPPAVPPLDELPHEPAVALSDLPPEPALSGEQALVDRLPPPLPDEGVPAAPVVILEPAAELRPAEDVVPMEVAPVVTVEIEPTIAEIPESRAAPDAPPAPVTPPVLEAAAPLLADFDEGGREQPTELTEEMIPEMVEEDGPPVPLVRTGTPAPPRAQSSRIDPASRPTPSVPPRPIERFVPVAEPEDWRRAAGVLDAEAARAPAAGRGALLAHAGRMLANRVGDAQAAVERFAAAVEAGSTDRAAIRGLEDAAADAGRWEEALTRVEARARHESGPAAADAWFDAALIARRQLGRVPAALDALDRALEAEPDHFAAAAMQRELLAQAPGDTERARAALARLAGIADGALVAEVWADQAAATADPAAALDAWGRARAAAPTYGAARVGAEAALRELGDPAALASFYETEAAAGGPEAGYWWGEAARAWARTGQADRARTAFAAASSDGDPSALREWEAWERASGNTDGAIVAIESQLEGATGTARAALAWRLGTLHEAAGRPQAALTAWNMALDADHAAWPAAEGVGRMLRSAGETGQLRERWKARVDAAATDDERRAARVVLGELAEATGDLDGAVTAWAAAAGVPDLIGWVATDAIARVGRARGDQRAAAGADLRRASWAADPVRAADYRWLALTGPGDGVDDASAEIHAILAADPGHPGAIDWLAGRAAEGPAAAVALERAGNLDEQPARSGALLYRAARAWIAAGSPADALRIAEDLSARAPDPLVAILAEDCGAGRRERWRERLRSEQGAVRSWAALAIGDDAELAQHLDAASDDRAVAGALEVLRLEASHRGGASAGDGLVDLYRRSAMGQPTTESAWASLRLARALHAAGSRAEAARALADLETMQVPGRPLRAAAHLAESWGEHELAARLLAPIDEPAARLERARLLERGAGQPAAALELYRSELERGGPRRLDAALGLARSALVTNDRAALVAGHQEVATLTSSDPMRAAYASWVSAWLEEDGDLAGALRHARTALALRPTSTDAFDSVARLLRGANDAAGLRELYAASRPGDPVALADALDRVGDVDGQIAVLSGADSGADALPALLRLEILHPRVGDWQAAYDALTRRRDVCADDDVRAAVDSRRRWILSEKLAQTDQAWDLYRQLHLDAPQDRDVTESLAGIAAARGDTGLAVQFLRELAEGAPTPADAARYQRRIGASCEATGDLAGARQAYLDALDHVRDDAEAIDGLKRLARGEEDWQGLVAVLQREAALATGDQRAEIRREIARVTEKNAADPALAIDGWRAVLDASPGDTEALAHLYQLAENAGQWEMMVEIGAQLAATTSGAPRGHLLQRLGEVAAEHIDAMEGMRFYEQAIANEPPDVRSAVALEGLCRSRGDLVGASRALQVQAHYAESPDDQAGAWARLGKIDLDRRDRESAAQNYLRAFQLKRDDEPTLRFLAGYLVESGRFTEALPVYEALEPFAAQEQDLDDPDVRLEMSTFWFNYGELLRSADRVDDAIPIYERALALNPAHLLSLEAVGAVYVGRKDWVKAERAYRQLLQVTGGQGERAKVASAYAQLGLVERALGSFDKAEKRFGKALEAFPNHVPALKGMALLAADKQDWSNLLNIYNNVIYHATVPQDVIDAYMTKGQVLDEQMNRPDKAAQHYQRSLDFDPNQPLAILRLAELSLRSADWIAAAGHTERALKLEPSKELTRWRGALLAAEACAMQGFASPTAPVRLAEAAAADPRFAAASLDDTPGLLAALRAVMAESARG